MDGTRSVAQVTRNEVARLAGVSAATVSYVVNDGPRHVAPDPRARVLAAIETLGYQPSDVARSLRTQRTATISLIVSDILNPFHSGIARSTGQAARSAEYTLILCNSDEDAQEERTFLQMLESKRGDGIVFDDVEYYSVCSPSISAVHYSLADLGDLSFSLLLDQMVGSPAERATRHERVPCTLQIRDSTQTARR